VQSYPYVKFERAIGVMRTKGGKGERIGHPNTQENGPMRDYREALQTNKGKWRGKRGRENAALRHTLCGKEKKAWGNQGTRILTEGGM